jgi:rhamnogalacturonan endolyase
MKPKGLMMMNSLKIGILLMVFLTMSHGARMVEALDRGLVVVNTAANTNFVSWRLKGYEPLDLGFNIYRNGVKINNSVLTGATSYSDNGGNINSVYTVRAVQNGNEGSDSKAVTPWNGLTKRIPLSKPAGGTTPSGEAYTYTANDISVGDLDGDGEYELILKWDPTNAKDNSQSGYTGNVFIDALKLDGTRLWRIDLGRNIRAGAHYTQFMVADFDLDGKAEMIVKTAPGTRDASGNLLSKGVASSMDNNDYRNSSGFIITGPEYLTVFGSNGMELSTVTYNPGRVPTNGWGKDTDNTNRVDRFLAAVAYLDGVRPHAVMQRGYYGRMTLAAWSWNGATLSQKWFFDSNANGNGACYSQGNHNLSVGDVDSDGNDEIIQGACAIDHDGKFMYATGLGHGDAIHLSDLIPSRPGLELMTPHEEKHLDYPGTEVHDARTGEILFEHKVDNMDVGRGMAADISGAHPGFEVWSSGTDGVYNLETGARITTTKPSINFRIYWDGDLQDEMLDGIGTAPSSMKIDHWNGSGMDRILSSDNRYGSYVGININGTKANPNLVADILGDWREEMILRESGDNALILYTTVIPTNHRIYTLMHDPVYRAAVAWQNVAYNQPPHLGFYIGGGVQNLPIPNIEPVGGDIGGSSSSGSLSSSSLLPESSSSSQTNPFVEPNLKIQGEDFCEGEGNASAVNVGFEGTGFFDFVNANGSWATWVVESNLTQNITLVIRYANGSANNRPLSLMRGVETLVPSIDFNSTGVWTTWQSVELEVSLNAGSNELLFTALTAEGGANIDYIGFRGTGVSVGSCSGPVGLAPVNLNNMNSTNFKSQYDILGRPHFVPSQNMIHFKH